MNTAPKTLAKVTSVDLDRICDESLHFITPCSMAVDNVEYAWKLDVKFDGVTLRQVFNTAVKDLRTDFQNLNRPGAGDKPEKAQLKKTRIKSYSNKTIVVEVSKKTMLGMPTPEEIITSTDDPEELAKYMKALETKMSALKTKK